MNLTSSIRKSQRTFNRQTLKNAAWLQESMSPFFFQAMSDEPEALATLARELATLKHNRHLVLADRDNKLLMACVDQPGSLYETLCRIRVHDVSYAMFSHSCEPMPGMEQELEVQRFEFDRKSNADINLGSDPEIPLRIKQKIFSELRKLAPEISRGKAEKLLSILWINNSLYVRMSPPLRIARLVRLFERGNATGGLYWDIQQVSREDYSETMVQFAVGNPPQEDFLLQVVEVFNRLDIGIRRAYCLTISNGIHPYFLGTFFLRHRKGVEIPPESGIASRLGQELCNTQILANESYTYRQWVTTGIMPGDDAALVNAFAAFCHTNLAHCQPEKFGFEDVQSAFHAHPEITIQLLRLFRLRFDPELKTGLLEQDTAIAEMESVIADYNTGHRWLDEIRRTIYSTCLLLIRHTLKTNFFVVEKQALAFRLSSEYLNGLEPEFRADLPDTLPFRITFFFSRFGHGYHIGFSDIARGGWRTVIARNQDDLITAANTLFREVFVLAHTQHLKNKDIYEGGSKMVVVMDSTDLPSGSHELETCRLYKLQYGIANAFLDVFTTTSGKASHPRVIDYYCDDEPIELGPDENMHDGMIEAIASLSRKRGYMLGIGIISSKRIGINHKQYGVTSTGVMSFVRTVMESIGTDIEKDPFSVKITGGPNGDVAGNCLRIILEKCPEARLTLILDGTAAVYDPTGINRHELTRITLRHDLDCFAPEHLNPGGTMIFRGGQRTEGLRKLHRKVSRSADGRLVDEWIALDDFYREYSNLIFTTRADLFIPAGGRPETIDIHNWKDFLLADATPSARVIVEGANSFITPDARVQLQKHGVILMRDASANKCGVISSSYEIIANLLLSEQEFLGCKEQYISDVLAILEKRAADEARLILKRKAESGGTLLYTEISDQISQNINSFYSRLFSYFSENPLLAFKRPFRDALLSHLPDIIRQEPRFRRRISRLPQKYLSAILAAEIGASLVYSGNRDSDFEEMVKRHLARVSKKAP